MIKIRKGLRYLSIFQKRIGLFFSTSEDKQPLLSMTCDHYVRSTRLMRHPSLMSLPACYTEEKKSTQRIMTTTVSATQENEPNNLHYAELIFEAKNYPIPQKESTPYATIVDLSKIISSR